MEENPVAENANGEVINGCMSCGNPEILADYPTPLCQDCRTRFVRFPIPMWIKIFAGAIVIVLLFSLFTLAKNISLGMHLERGKKAEKEKKYLTAQQNFEEVVNQV